MATDNSKHIVIDPITRIEGHLKVEVAMDGDVVENSWVSAQLYRGIEQILAGRDPQDAPFFTQRVCGVCTTTHMLTSVRAIENALGVTPPPMAVLMRNLILAALDVQDHMVHFYHLHGFDWIDMAAATKADPVKAAAIAAEGTERPDDPAQFFIVQKRLRDFVASGQLGPLENAPFLGGHPAYNLTPEENLVLSAHYLEALRIQLKLGRAMAIFSGKNPHAQTMVVGGMTCYDALRPEMLGMFRKLWEESHEFIQNGMMKDIALLAKRYPEAARYGRTTNYICFDDFTDSDGQNPYFRSGIMWSRDFDRIEPLDMGRIEEHVAHSWYEGDTARKPWDGRTEPKYTSYDDKEKYSWVKAPRYMGEPMETGPLARRAIAYGRGEKETVEAVDSVFGPAGLKTKALFSTMGRTVCRVVETLILSRRMEVWMAELEKRAGAGEHKIYVDWEMKDGKGVGTACVTRGALSHWIRIENGRIGNYQMVVPSTWNLGPRCAEGKMSPSEESLLQTKLEDPERPIEILRTIHSYDPCIACSVHLVDVRGKTLFKG